MKDQFKLFLKFLKYLIPYRRKQAIIFVLGMVSVLLELINPYLSKFIVDKAIMNKELKTFIILGLLSAGIFILNGLMKAIASFLGRGIHLRVRFDLSKKVFKHMQGFSLSLFQNKATGQHMFNLSYDIERAVDFIVFIPEGLVNIFPKLILTLIIIFYLNWQMAVFSFILAPILYLPIFYLTRRMLKALEELMANSQNIFARLEEVFSHIYLVKAFGKEKKETRSYLRALITNIKISLKNMRLEIISTFSSGSAERVIIGLITLFGGYQVIKGRISLGTLTAIMIYLSQLIVLQSSLVFFFQRMSFGLVSCKRLDQVLGERPKGYESGLNEKIIFKEPTVRFNKVSFGYNQGEYILKDIGFFMEKGRFALVGPSGCGKTTILNLILGLYEPWQGEIFIEGHNVRDLEPLSLKEQIGVALQEPFLWNDTIENNIKYAKSQAVHQEVVEVARLTGIDDFIKDLSAGYQTIIGENACKLSEGQKQKIALARALIKKPKILILDEAMSSIDSAGEEKIVTQLNNAFGIHTVIIIAHRLSTVLACDLAYFLKGPDTMIVGSPQQLLKEDQDFYNLFAAQIKDTGG